MYAWIPEIGSGFFAGVCAPSNATANSYDHPTPQHERTGALAVGLRPDVDHASPYRWRRFSLG